MMLTGHGHQEVMACKGYATSSVIYFNLLKYSQNTFAHLKIGWSDNKGVLNSSTHLGENPSVVVFIYVKVCVSSNL